MNRSNQNMPTSSPGFVYFNTSTPPQEYHNKADTPEFLAFGDSPKAPPYGNRFTPNHYSSPKGRYQSPRSYPSNNRRYQRWSGNRNQSFNSSSSFNQSNNNKSFKNETNTAQYLHSSFTEDPWSRLISEHSKKQEQSIERNQEGAAPEGTAIEAMC